MMLVALMGHCLAIMVDTAVILPTRARSTRNRSLRRASMTAITACTVAKNGDGDGHRRVPVGSGTGLSEPGS